jgi:hypothetical protein
MGIEDHVIGGATVTPRLVAELFWEMNSEEQADFYAKLYEISDGMLCQQTAYLVSEIRKRAMRGDTAAREGFQTMLAHSTHYVEDAIDSMVWNAKYDIEDMVRAAKAQVIP